MKETSRNANKFDRTFRSRAIRLNDRQSKTLENMADEMGTTKAGVRKTALVVLEIAIRERKEGHSLGIIKGDDVVKEIIGIG